jgi:hypothetical protein
MTARLREGGNRSPEICFATGLDTLEMALRTL